MAASYLKLIIDGNWIQDVILQHVSVTQALNDHWRSHVELRHMEDQRGGTSSITVEEWLGKDFQVTEVEDNLSEHPLFDGFLLEVELVYEHSGAYAAFLQGITRSYKMDVTQRHAYYQEMTLADIATRLASNANLQAKVTCQDRRPLNYVQWGESDFEFLHRLADDHGCWMRPSAEGIEIFDAFQGGATVYWRKESGEDALRGFSVKGALAPPAFNGAHYDFHQMRSKVYESVSDQPQFYDSVSKFVSAAKEGSDKNVPPAYLHQRSRVVTLDEYETLLKKESVRSMGGTVIGSGESINSKLLPGNEVTIDGTDAAGTYGVTHVSHNWDVSGYTNQFTCTPWKNYTDPNPPAVKPWFGIVPARVVEHNDPKKMGRIKVQYFWQEDGTAYWARMMTPHAGGDRGFMFMPEVGDEVVVVFEDGDPERPVVLGCVWNGVDQAPRQGFWDKNKDVEQNSEMQANEVKRIVTKSGNRLQMVDSKGKESIVLSTPNSVKVALIDQAAETGREALVLQVDEGDIILNAPQGRIHFYSKYFSREIG
jgi:type VI secretion system secreted protein VgrG